MKIFTKLLCLLLALVMTLSLFGCGKTASSDKNNKTVVEVEPYIGTWEGNDHDGENIVHYLIFDEQGYWNVYMNYGTLLRAIKQLPDQLVSFKVFRELQKSEHTGCYYEYVEDIAFTEKFSIDPDNTLTSVGSAEVFFTKVSTHSGEPSSDVAAEARDLFDRALVEANSK